MDAGNDMTDTEIGKLVRETAERGYDVKTRINKGKIIIMKERCDIVAKEELGEQKKNFNQIIS